MIRGLFIFAKIAILAAIGYWLAEQPGHISIELAGWRVDASIGIMALALLILVVALYFVVSLYRAIRKAPKQFQENRALSRREKGYRALTQGLVAVAAGDKLEAQRQSRKANTLLNDPPLTMLLSAQSAQLNGDEKAAEKFFEAMLDHPQAAFLGVRGLMMQAAKEGDQDKALELAQKAHDLRPDTPWVLTELLELQDDAKDWDGALKTVEEAIKAKALPLEEGKKRKAEILMQKARIARDEGNEDIALNLVKRSVRVDPSLAPAVTLYARLLLANGKLRKAEKLIEDAWKLKPNAALAYTYKDLNTSVNELEQVKRFEKLTQSNQDHAESHFAMARIALDAALWGEARKQTAPLIDKASQENKTPSPRLCRLMAELEEKEHHDMAKAHHWLELASTDNEEVEID
ncbi:heme biosynthesis protein HemY [Curvivirga sp.]|uniref:heme biosynthesis protein HemY n=1 Tax=Curvivirga sp. TaxID=2856848 RepID=UPI003B5BE9B0